MKRRVVIADNDEPVRKMVGRLLESENYEVHVVQANGPELIQAISDSTDLIVLEVNASASDSQKALEMIDSIHSGIPVVAVTASLAELRTINRISARAGAILEKPLDPARLIAAVRGLLDEADQARALAGVQRTAVG